ncbi:hypothetical protein RB195_015447 [Necator americanus]|uniref:Uncharacterized protein n=1 Tax=Necator americanus TaxID=51031 RepID=A0ABR1E5S8_NECAM
MESSLSTSGNEFPPIARRFILNKKSCSTAGTSTVSISQDFDDTKPPTEERVFSASRSNAEAVDDKQIVGSTAALVSRVLCPQPAVSYYCNLCLRLRSVTAERLRAPVEKQPFPPVNGSCKIRNGRPPCLGLKTKVVLSRVRVFFEELKNQLGHTCRGTLLNSPTQMAALACGVSRHLVRRAAQESSDLYKCPRRLFESPPPPKKRPEKDENTTQMMSLKKYGEEWGEVVRHFALNELKSDMNLTVDDLRNRLCTAYAGFPISSSTLYDFLKMLGFSYRLEEGISYIIFTANEIKNEDL